MNVIKQKGDALKGQTDREELEAVNSLTRRELGEEEVYLFTVRLCDNEVDRDGERFSTQTLEELAPMFVGRSGIFDHNWTAAGQVARIYRCELVREQGRMTRAGDGYCWLKGYAYILRTEGSRQLIEEIEGGIKKEVSIGCSVRRKVCSVCGGDVTRTPCEHRKGERYDGKLCYITLEGAQDAYEFSFVAVPAQPAAGVVKTFGADAARQEQLEREAAVGRACMQKLREDVVRLGLLAGLELEAKQLRDMANSLGWEQLEQLKTAYGRQVERQFPMPVQLRYENVSQERRQCDAAFLI